MKQRKTSFKMYFCHKITCIVDVKFNETWITDGMISSWQSDVRCVEMTKLQYPNIKRHKCNSPSYLPQVVTLTLPPANIDKYLIYNLAKKRKSLSLFSVGFTVHYYEMSLDRQIIYTMH